MSGRLKPWQEKQRRLRSTVKGCGYCGCALDRKHGSPRQATVDHKQPISRGGVNRPKNFAVACAGCNRLKGAMTAKEFLAAYPTAEALRDALLGVDRSLPAREDR